MKLLVSHWRTVLVALNARISCCLEDEAQPSVAHEVSFTLENLLSRRVLMLKSTELVHLAAIYINAVSVFKSWSHTKSET